jgi:hypothetical protein
LFCGHKGRNLPEALGNVMYRYVSMLWSSQLYPYSKVRIQRVDYSLHFAILDFAVVVSKVPVMFLQTSHHTDIRYRRFAA